MTPADRRQAELDRIFQAGWDNAADFAPLTDEEIDIIAALIRPDILLRPRTTKAEPLPAAA